MEGYTVRRLLTSIDVNPEGFSEQVRDALISGVSTDSRSIQPGEVFFAIKGDTFDGTKFIDDAARGGALLSIVEHDASRQKPYETPIAVVENTVKALGKVAADYRSTFQGKVVAVTGTTGKTTVKDMLLSIIGKKYRVHGTKGNFNNQIGLPYSIMGLRQSHECAVFELGMSAPGEIAELADITKPDIGVILNVGPGHAEFFESIGAIADEKMELLSALNEKGIAVINGDDDLLLAASERTAAKVVRFGLSSTCEYRADDIVINPQGCAQFRANGDVITLQVPGFYSVYNAMAAYAVARELDIKGQTIAEALASFEATDLRMQLSRKNGIHFINDAYNANPLSMSAAAEVMKLSEGSRKIAVLGDMLELGDISVQAHRDVGERFADIGVDMLCLVGTFADAYADGAKSGGLESENIRRFASIEEVTDFLDTEKKSGDLILVKGSRALRMERIINALNGDT